MKAFVLSKAGDRRNLHIAQMEKPEPKEGEVRVRVHSVGLNPVDYKLAEWGHAAWTYPHILGVDGSGWVEKLGPGVTQFQEKDRVYFHLDMTKQGSFADYAICAVHTLARMPPKMAFEEAAAVPCAGWTAYQALHRKLNLKPEQKILIHAGSGGVGSYAIQMARRLGLEIYTTCSAENFGYVRDLGAHHVIDYRTEDVFSRVMAFTNGRGLNTILDTLGGPTLNENFKMLAFNGSLVSLVDVPDITVAPMFEKALTVHMMFLGGAYTMGSFEDQKELGRTGEEVARLLEERILLSTVSEILPFEKIPEGLERLASHRTRGKLVARVAEG